MKKKLAIIGTVTLLGVGAAVLSNQEWRANTIFATARDKQLAWVKEHEEEIVKWMHSTYPKVESVQFDWQTLKVLPVSNGVFAESYNLSVKGTFNNIANTFIIIDFRLEKQDSIPNM